jgi:hypothetical protein
MAVTVPAQGAIVIYGNNGSNQMPGGGATFPAIVISANGLAVTVKAFSTQGDAVVQGVEHISVASVSTGQNYWDWPATSGNSNS